MKQCENCTEWVDDTYRILWPVYESLENDVYYVCSECADHLRGLKNADPEPPDVGSPAAQRDYKKTSGNLWDGPHGNFSY